MYARCLLCRAPFPENGILERLPLGSRVAYDLQRGRLWQACRACGRWSLLPMEDRWEAMEELERVVSGARPAVHLASRTPRIALFRTGTGSRIARPRRSLEIVRVGGAGPAEEAWWRYGDRLRPHPHVTVLNRLIRRPWALRRRGKGKALAWKGRKRCPGCGHVFTELSADEHKIMVVRPRETGDGPICAFTLSRRCPRCRDVDRGGLHLAGIEADLALGRALASAHHRGATMDQINGALRIADDVGGPSPLVRLLTRHGRPLGDLPLVGSLAVEMYAAEARELALLKLEAEELEARWRREEELAALVDGDLTPVTRLAELRRKANKTR